MGNKISLKRLRNSSLLKKTKVSVKKILRKKLLRKKILFAVVILIATTAAIIFSAKRMGTKSDIYNSAIKTDTSQVKEVERPPVSFEDCSKQTDVQIIGSYPAVCITQSGDIAVEILPNPFEDYTPTIEEASPTHKKYVNNLFGYTITYPKSLVVNNDYKASTFELSVDSEGPTYPIMFVLSVQANGGPLFYNAHLRYLMNHERREVPIGQTFEMGHDEYTRLPNTVIDGVPAIVFEGNSDFSYSNLMIYMIDKDFTTYIIGTYFNPQEPSSLQQFSEILSTFKFINIPDETSTWQTQKFKSLSFKIPPGWTASTTENKAIYSNLPELINPDVFKMLKYEKIRITIEELSATDSAQEYAEKKRGIPFGSSPWIDRQPTAYSENDFYVKHPQKPVIIHISQELTGNGYGGSSNPNSIAYLRNRIFSTIHFAD